MRSTSLDDILDCPDLPTLPRVAVEVLELTRDPEVRLGDIAEVVQYDQALCGKLLRTVNSSYYRLAEPCPTVSRAMAYLGLNAVKTLVLSFGLVDVTRRGVQGLNLLEYWRRCVFSAATAREIAKLTETCEPEEAFIAALMQDVGMLPMHAARARDYRRIVERTEGDHRRLPALERSTLGFTHAEAGAGLGSRWKLPDRIIEPIRLHHGDDGGAAHLEYSHLVRAVSMSCHVTTVLAFDGGLPELTTVRALGDRYYNFSPRDVRELFRRAVTEARSVSELLAVNVGSEIDVDVVLAAAEEARTAHQLHLSREARELRAENEKLAQAALVDGLTGIANRNAFDRELDRRFNQVGLLSGQLAIVMVDVDHFKSLNDTHGHQAGDAVLVEIAARLARGTGQQGMVCRYGGEEFAIILPGHDRRSATALAETLRGSIAQTPVRLPDGTTPVTASFGVAARTTEVGDPFTRSELLVAAADRALYAAKRSGRDEVRTFRPGPVTDAA